MTAFRDQLRAFSVKVEARSAAVFVRTTELVQRSVVEGDPITGAPGQPVDTGNLKASWIGDFVNPARWQLTTNVEYAPYIEDGVGKGPLTLRSAVGGFHSVKLTAAAIQRLVEVANQDVRDA